MTTDTETTADTATGAPARVRRAKASSAASTTANTAQPAPSKSDTVIKLLRARGATPMELIAATDWQAHSARAFLSRLRKKGRTIVREASKTGDFAYRIVIVPSVDPVPATPAASDTPASGAADA